MHLTHRGLEQQRKRTRVFEVNVDSEIIFRTTSPFYTEKSGWSVDYLEIY